MKAEIEYGRRRDAYGKETFFFFSFIVSAVMQLPTSPLLFFFSSNYK